MTLQAEIDEAKRVLDSLIRRQNQCQHKWSTVTESTYIDKEWYDTGQYEKHGIHIDPIGAMREVRKPQWTRTCLNCGKVERTTEQKVKEVTTTYEPKF